jgi:hypothetical protein
MERLRSVVHGLAPVNIRPLTAHTWGARDSSRFHPVHVVNIFNFNISISIEHDAVVGGVEGALEVREHDIDVLFIIFERSL